LLKSNKAFINFSPPSEENSSAVDRKPTVAELTLLSNCTCEDDDDITFIEAIKEAKDVRGPITRCEQY